MRPFAYSAPATLDDAIASISDSKRPLAGGTDLLTLMNADLAAPDQLVAVRRLLPCGVDAHDGTVTLGAGTLLSDIEAHPDLNARFTAVAQAAALAASPQLRNTATLGGNLLQRPRCWYFREAALKCWLKGGDTCLARDGQNQRHAVFGASPCVAVHPSDLATALVAFDASLTIRGPSGERTVSLDEFFALPAEDRRTENTLGSRELILGVNVPTHPPETRSLYLKAMDRAAFSFALVAVAAVVRLSPEGRIGHARIVLGGVAPIPWRAGAAEAVLLGHEVTGARLRNAAQAAVTGA
ncbi:MAG: FAD binding domain-containing protein, partial [Rhodospirillaceae bacterium]